MSGPLLDLGGLLGETEKTASERFGVVAVDRVLGEDRWMVFEGTGWSLRLRARPGRAGEPARVRSWTVTFEQGFATLEAACEALALPAPPPTADPRTLRFPFPDVRSRRIHSLTATVRRGLVLSLTGFDEPPDWGDGAGSG